MDGPTLTLNEEIEASDLISAGQFELAVDRVVEKPHTGYLNPLNSGIVRYYDFGGGAHDTYSAVAIKIVLLASSPRLVPKVDDYRVVGLSV